jgi:hypothetical protein
MKGLRKVLILIFFLLISVTSMVTGVFAWFIGGEGASVESLGTKVISDVVLDIHIDQSDIFLGDRVRDLVYITDDEFHTSEYDFYGYAAILEVEIQNSSDEAAKARLTLKAQDALEYGIYAGVDEGFMYLVVSNPLNVNGIMWQFQLTPGSIFTQMKAYNNEGITIPAQSITTVYIMIWGYYDGLPEYQLDIYHAVVYRMTMGIQ